MKIRINKLPKKLTKALVGKQVQGSLAITPSSWGGGNYSNSLANKPTQVRETLQPVPTNVANLEAEKGEYAYGGISGDNIPDNFKIGGKRHSEGGTPLNLPKGTFIFSDTASMKIKDPAVLKMFDLKPKKGGFTPADIAKKYDINSYKKILYDPNTDELTRKTATLMIKNYTMKLGFLSMIQEGMKGFPQGMPEAAQPVLETMGYSMEQFVPAPVREGQQEIMAQEETENGEPQQMPDGQPVASMETMYGDDANAQQMPVNPPMPMAEYGMTLGGYGMPMYSGGGITPYGAANTAAGNITPTGQRNEFVNTGLSVPQLLEKWEPFIPGIKNVTDEAEAQKKIYEWSLQNNPDAIRNMWQTHGLTAKGRGISSLEALTNSGKFDASTLANQQNLTSLQQGYVDDKFGVRQLLPPDPKPKDCPCEDAQGNVIPGKFAQKDANGDCLPETCNETPGPKDCPCLDAEGKAIPGKFAKKDANGKCLPETCNEGSTVKKKCKCVDPQTGAETITEIGEDEECNCPQGYSGQMIQDDPVYSDIATRNILTQATMNPNVPRSSSVLPDAVEMPGAYKDYLSQIQNIGRGQSSMMNMIQGTAGSAGEDFAKAMATTAQSQAANQAAVAGTVEDNITAARQVGQFNAQAKGLNNAQRADIWNQQIAATAGEKGMENMARNQIAQNKQMGIADAEAELQGRMLSNFENQQYGTTYRRGVPYFKQGKPNVPEKPSDVNKRIKELQAIYGKDAKIGDLLQIIKMEQQNAKKGGQAKGGPYVLASTIYPFIF